MKYSIDELLDMKIKGKKFVENIDAPLIKINEETYEPLDSLLDVFDCSQEFINDLLAFRDDLEVGEERSKRKFQSLLRKGIIKDEDIVNMSEKIKELLQQGHITKEDVGYLHWENGWGLKKFIEEKRYNSNQELYFVIFMFGKWNDNHKRIKL